jgi:hypothetical protein
MWFVPMGRIIKAAIWGEIIGLIVLAIWTYCYPRPPVFVRVLSDPKIGPAWYITWRERFDEDGLLDGFMWGYGNQPDATQRLVRGREELISIGYWLLFMQACLNDGSILLISPAVVVFAAILRSRAQKKAAKEQTKWKIRIAV